MSLKSVREGSQDGGDARRSLLEVSSEAVKGNVLRGESVRGVSKVRGRELIGQRVRQEERDERRALEVFKGRVAQIRRYEEWFAVAQIACIHLVGSFSNGEV